MNPTTSDTASAVPTPYEHRLVYIGIVIQFYVAAFGHLVLWIKMFHELRLPPEPNDEGRFITEIFVYQGIPVSFGVLVAVYILFRLLLALTRFQTALGWMIGLNIFHSIIMFFAVITPLRLLIPTILYAVAYRSYSGRFAPSPRRVSTDIPEEPS